MSLLIIHLTDLHLDPASENFIEKADLIVDSALSPTIEVSAVHIVFSGDLCNKTIPVDFPVVANFLARLKSKVVDRLGVEPKMIMVAGNHDCDFAMDQTVRDMLIQGVRAKPTALAPAVADQISVVLNRFFEFRRAQMPADLVEIDPWCATYIADGIRYVLLNSAVMSVLREDPGRLIVPLPVVEPLADHKTIFVMHHPYNWLTPDNARELAQHVAPIGDLFLMGHEHESWAQQVSDLYEETSITYLRGHVLRDPADPSNSAFQTLHVDLNDGYLPRSYRMAGGKYEVWHEKTKEDFAAWPKNNGNRQLSLTQDAFKSLSSPGASFSHRRKDAITLQDIFVWPSLMRAVPQKETGNVVQDGLTCSAETLLQDFDEFPSVVVIRGGEQSGKSALAKILALQLGRKGVHPLMLTASAVSSWRQKGLDERIDQAIDAMYGKQHRDAYRSQNAASKVLIIDDFDLTQVAKGYFDGLRALRQHFGRIYLMLDSHPGMEVALNEFLRDENFVDSEIYDITPSTYHHRLELIERWLTIGAASEDFEEQKVTAARLLKVVDETLGRNLIPAVPIFVLIILQRAELAQDLNTVVKSGSHGFLYESLITQALSNKVNACNVVTSLTYLTAFAGLCDRKKVDSISQTEFDAFHVEHCQRFNLKISLANYQAQLVAAEILDDRGDVVRFRYPFHSYYFLARYISQITDWSVVEPRIDSLVESIHTERNANVLLFLAHLGRNPRVNEKVLATAKSMFSGPEHAEANVFAPIAALQKFSPGAIREIIYEGSRALQLEQHQLEEKNAEKATRELTELAEARLKARLDDAARMNAAFKTLQVLGQILRNHAGEIEKAEKHDVANTCVALGLRILNFMFKMAEAHGDEMVAFRSMQIKADRPELTQPEILAELENYLPSWITSVTVGTLIKIANAIGSEDLTLTIEDVLKTGDTRRLIHIVTQLEHFADFPKKDILDFEEDVLRHGSFLPNSVLRRFIIRRFYLFPVRDELKRPVLEKFKIQALPFQFLEQRRLPKTS